ncbi:MFS transporter, partial [bacterium]|nr:MFS transporter [bacterium]
MNDENPDSALETPDGPPAPREEGKTSEPSLRPFFFLWGGQTLSLIGSNAVQFALIWWLTAQSGSATILATATLFGLVPQIALGPMIGTLVDRWDRKKVMLLADALVAAASLVLAVLYATHAVRNEHVLALLFVRALGGAFHVPAMTASTSLMVPERRLTQIQGLNQSAQGLLLIVGAPLGGLLFSLLPMAGVMLVDVGTALVAIGPLLFIRVPKPNPASNSNEESSVWGEMIDGFRYLRERTGHLTLVI